MKLIMNVIGYELDDSNECIIPDGVVEIKEKTFYGCKDITSINIPESVMKIGASAFYGCWNLESIEIKSDNIEICFDAFLDCKRLRQIIFEKNVTLEIGYSAFSSCENLEEIILPQGLIEVSDYVFYRCIRLSNIKFPESLKEIGFFSFGECENLKTVIIPNGVKKIERLAFSKCKNLESVTIPDSIKDIASNSFEQCDNIQNVNVSSYSVYNLLTGKIKLVATKSILKNYYTKTTNYTKEEIQDLKEYIIENRIKLFPYAIGDYDLYRFMFKDMDKIYSLEDLDKLFNKINDEYQFGEWAKISKTEANAFLLQYVHNNNLHAKFDELTLDDLDEDKPLKK